MISTLFAIVRSKLAKISNIPNYGWWLSKSLSPQQADNNAARLAQCWTTQTSNYTHNTASRLSSRAVIHCCGCITAYVSHSISFCDPSNPFQPYPPPTTLLDTYSNNVDKGRLARVLQPDQRQLHLLLPEQALEPIQNPIDQGQHFSPTSWFTHVQDD